MSIPTNSSGSILDGFIEATECAKELGICTRTLRDLNAPHVKLGRRRIYSREAIRAWVLSGGAACKEGPGA